MLLNHAPYLINHEFSLGRVGHSTGHEQVPAMWHFALTDLNWEVFPAERGVGNAPLRVTSKRLWRLPEGVRRNTGYAQQLIVAPVGIASAAPLLRSLGVPSIGEAPLNRLFGALSNLAGRLENEMLQTRTDALSLANVLYAAINDRLKVESMEKVTQEIQLPLRHERRLVSANPRLATTRIVFDDDPARSRHIPGFDDACLVPMARETSFELIHRLFVKSWGSERMLRSSTAPIALEFTLATSGVSTPFLTWLRATFPHTDVAAELAALLTYGSERTIMAEKLTRH